MTNKEEKLPATITDKIPTLTIKEKIISVGYSLLRYLFLFLIITFAFPKLLKNIKEKYAFRTITDHLVTAGTGIIAMFLFQ